MVRWEVREKKAVRVHVIKMKVEGKRGRPKKEVVNG